MKPIQKNGKWFARVCVAGQRVSKTFRTKREADQWTTCTEAELLSAGQPKGRGPQQTTLAESLRMMAEVETRFKKGAKQEIARINRWLIACEMPALKLVKNPVDGYDIAPADTPRTLPGTFSEYQQKRLARSKISDAYRTLLGKMPMANIATHHLRDFENAMRDSGWKPDSIRIEMAMIKHLFMLAKDNWNWFFKAFPFNGYKMPKPGAARDVRIPLDKEKKLFEELARCKSKLILPYVNLAIETAMRKGETMCTATWNAVDFAGRSITLKTDKAGTGRKVPLTRRAIAILQQLQSAAVDERIFALTEDQLQSAWRKACQRADIENLRIHDMRHESLSRHAERLNGNVHILMKISGHKDLKMLLRYINTRHSDVINALDRSEEITLSSVSDEPNQAHACEQETTLAVRPELKLVA